MNTQLEQSIDIMAETLLQQLQTHVDNNDIESSDAIYSEWITPDSNDPQDGNYQFIYIPHFSNLWIKMTLNQQQLDQLKENYANQIIDGMDNKTLEQFAFDTIIQSMETWDTEDVLDDIKIIYDDELATEMLEEVSN